MQLLVVAPAGSWQRGWQVPSSRPRVAANWYSQLGTIIVMTTQLNTHMQRAASPPPYTGMPGGCGKLSW